MRWIRAAIVGLVVAVISLVAVTAVQSVLGSGEAISLTSTSNAGRGFFAPGVSVAALVAAIAGFLLGFTYEFKRSGK